MTTLLQVFHPNGVTVDVTAMLSSSVYVALNNMELILPEMDLPLARLLLTRAEELNLNASILTTWKNVIGVLEESGKRGQHNTFRAKLMSTKLGGRVYGLVTENGSWAGCMLNNKKFFKNTMYTYAKCYGDYDQVRSHPILLFILGTRLARLTNPDGTRKYPLVDTGGLRHYILHREEVIAMIIGEFSVSNANSVPLDKDDVKSLFNRATYGGDWAAWERDLMNLDDDPLRKTKLLRQGRHPPCWESYKANVASITEALYLENTEYATFLREDKMAEYHKWKSGGGGFVRKEGGRESSFAKIERDAEGYFRQRLLSFVLQIMETFATFSLYEELLERRLIRPCMMDWAHDGITAWHYRPQQEEERGRDDDECDVSTWMRPLMPELNASVRTRTGLLEDGIGVEFDIKPFTVPEEARCVLEWRAQLVVSTPGTIGGVIDEHPQNLAERLAKLPPSNIADALYYMRNDDPSLDQEKAKDQMMINQVVPLLNRCVAFQKKGGCYVMMSRSTEPIKLHQSGPNAKEVGYTKYAESWEHLTQKPHDLKEDAINWKVRCQYAVMKSKTASSKKAGGGGSEITTTYETEVFNAFEQWRRHRKRGDVRETIISPWTYEMRGLDFVPNQELHNRWCPFPFDRVCEGFFAPSLENLKDVWLVLRHIFFIMGEEYKMWRTFLCFLAHMVQFPAELPGVLFFLQSAQGTGKDVLFNFIINMLGETHAVTTAKIELVLGEKNGLGADKTLVILSESDGTNWRTAYDSQLKTMVTDRRATHRKLYQEATISNQAPRVVRILNPDEIDLALGKVRESRRGMFAECSERPKGHFTDYFAPLDKLSIREPVLMTMHWLLQRIDITDWVPHELVYSRFHRRFLAEAQDNELPTFLRILLENYQDGMLSYFNNDGNAPMRRVLFDTQNPVCEVKETSLRIQAQPLFDAWCIHCEGANFVNRDKAPKMFPTSNAFGRVFSNDNFYKTWINKKHLNGKAYYELDIEAGLAALDVRLNDTGGNVPDDSHALADITMTWRKRLAKNGDWVDEHMLLDPRVKHHVERISVYIKKLEGLCLSAPKDPNLLFYDPLQEEEDAEEERSFKDGILRILREVNNRNKRKRGVMEEKEEEAME